MAVRLGVAFVPSLPPETLVPLARAVEASGLDELWVWEDCFTQSGVASAAVALASTERITVGIGLLPVAFRNAALAAMELDTLSRQFPGRLIAGLGHGVQEWMRQTGAKVDSPMTLLDEHTDAITRLLAGEQVTVEGRYVRLDGVRLGWPPEPPPPVMLGGFGPKSIALGARASVGNLLSGTMSLAELADAVEHIRASGAGPDHAIVTSVITAMGPGSAERAAAEVTAWQKEPAYGCSAAGEPAGVAAVVRDIAACGASTVVFQPTRDEPDVLALVRTLGTDVGPLVR